MFSIWFESTKNVAFRLQSINAVATRTTSLRKPLVIPGWKGLGSICETFTENTALAEGIARFVLP